MASPLIIAPPELIDHIASFISSPKDLLSLALTSSRFPGILIPHLQTCTLHCDIARRSVWSNLSRRPSVALRIRHLVLLVDSNPLLSATVIPLHVSQLIDSQQWETPPLQLPPYLAAAGLMDLIAVLPMMTNLHHFGWRDSRLYEPEHLDMLFGILAYLPDVKSLDINQLPSHTSYSFDLEIVGLSLWDMSNLVSFKLTVVCVDKPTWSHIMAMLIERCPALEILDVGVYGGSVSVGVYGESVDVGRLFFEANWPQLRTLSLIGDLLFFPPMCVVHVPMTTNAFWERHPKLESLTLMPSLKISAGKERLYIPQTATMSLRDLALTYNGELLFWIAPAVVRNVTFFRLQSMVLTPYMVNTCLKILWGMTTLRYFSLAFWNPEWLEDLVNAIQCVEVLHWIIKPAYKLKHHSIFTALPHLTHIAGILPAFSPGAPPPDALSVIHVLSMGPSLRYLSTEFAEGTDDFPVWIDIQRDMNGTYAGCRSIARDETFFKKGLGGQWMPMPL